MLPELYALKDPTIQNIKYTISDIQKEINLFSQSLLFVIYINLFMLSL